jgi:mannose-6-phosphate isomerase-like protein (cupin superfamily)
MMRRRLVAVMVAGLLSAVVCSSAAHAQAGNNTVAGVTVQTLAQASAKSLPAGNLWFSIHEYHQDPGAAYGPIEGLPWVVYTLHGIATISSPSAPTRSVGPGEAAFIPALVQHTNENAEGRVGAGAIAVGLVVLVIVLCAATWLRAGLRRVVIPALSVLLIAGGVLALSGATANDWYIFAVRPEWQRTLVMPEPYGRRAFESPDVNPRPAAPYTETLSAVTVPPGARYDAFNVPGPEMIIVVTGSASVHVGDQTQQLAGGGAAFTQAGGTLAIVNRGSDTLHVLDFAVTPPSAALAPT